MFLAMESVLAGADENHYGSEDTMQVAHERQTHDEAVIALDDIFLSDKSNEDQHDRRLKSQYDMAEGTDLEEHVFEQQEPLQGDHKPDEGDNEGESVEGASSAHGSSQAVQELAMMEEEDEKEEEEECTEQRERRSDDEDEGIGMDGDELVNAKQGIREELNQVEKTTASEEGTHMVHSSLKTKFKYVLIPVLELWTFIELIAVQLSDVSWHQHQ